MLIVGFAILITLHLVQFILPFIQYAFLYAISILGVTEKIITVLIWTFYFVVMALALLELRRTLPKVLTVQISFKFGVAHASISLKK